MDDENIFKVNEGTEYEEIDKVEKNKLRDELKIDEEIDIFGHGNQPYREELRISKKHIEYIKKKRE